MRDTTLSRNRGQKIRWKEYIQSTRPPWWASSWRWTNCCRMFLGFCSGFLPISWLMTTSTPTRKSSLGPEIGALLNLNTSAAMEISSAIRNAEKADLNQCRQQLPSPGQTLAKFTTTRLREPGASTTREARWRLTYRSGYLKHPGNFTNMACFISYGYPLATDVVLLSGFPNTESFNKTPLIHPIK